MYVGVERDPRKRKENETAEFEPVELGARWSLVLGLASRRYGTWKDASDFASDLVWAIKTGTQGLEAVQKGHNKGGVRDAMDGD